MGRNEPQVGKPITYCPGAAGVKNWNSMAYSPRTGLLYIPANEVCTSTTATSEGPVEGRRYFNGDTGGTLPPNRTTYSHLDAWDPVSGKRLWSYPYRYVLLASVLATAGDLVFTGDPEGEFFALNARSGEKLWRYQTGAGHRGSAVSYTVSGRLYIATGTGWGSVVGASFAALFSEQTFRLGSTVVVFALPE